MIDTESSIVVLDSFDQRRLALARLCAEVCANVFEWKKERGTSRLTIESFRETSTDRGDIPKAEHTTLLLAHAGEPSADKMAVRSHSDHIVWYGGYEGVARADPRLRIEYPNDDKIFAKIEGNDLPIDNGDIRELLTYARRHRAGDEGKPKCLLPPLGGGSLFALSILCQGYAAAGIMNGEIPVDGSLAADLGWDRLQADAGAHISEWLVNLWPRMKTIEWWRSSLGISADDGKGVNPIKFQAWLVQLIHDLDLDHLARKKLGLALGQNLADQTFERLLSFLEEQPDAADTIVLLKASQVPQELVAKLFKHVKRILEQR